MCVYFESYSDTYIFDSTTSSVKLTGKSQTRIDESETFRRYGGRETGIMCAMRIGIGIARCWYERSSANWHRHRRWTLAKNRRIPIYFQWVYRLDYEC